MPDTPDLTEVRLALRVQYGMRLGTPRRAQRHVMLWATWGDDGEELLCIMTTTLTDKDQPHE